jgi:osmotically-inducible protein OsmY
MRIRSAASGLPSAALILLLALGAAACGDKGENANNSNAANTNARANTNVTVATPTPASASEDTAIKNKVEANLSKYGVTGVTVEVNDGVVTLKGDVPAAKFQDAVKAGNEAGAKRVMNQLNKK